MKHPAETPHDDNALDHHLDRFVARLRARLITGAATYGDTSFTRPAPELVDDTARTAQAERRSHGTGRS